MNTFKCAVLICSLLFFSCRNNDTQVAGFTTDATKPTVYYNGDILTMEGDTAGYAEAITVKDGKVLYAGTKAGAIQQAGSGAQQIDLQGRTLMPGFIDAHGHVGLAADYKRYAFLRGEKIRNIPDLIKAMQELAREQQPKPGQFILGNGFDRSLLAEKRNPTADELDQVSKENPVYIIHASGHMGVANHKALELAGFTAQSKDPAGGKIERKPGSQEPSGVLEENAHFKLWEMVPPLDDQTGPKYLKMAMDQAVATGLTTIQEAGMKPAQMPVLIDAARKGILPIDVVAFATDVFSEQLRQILTAPANTPIQTMIPGSPVSKWGEEAIRSGKDYLNGYKGGFRIAGLKMWMDGSPLAGTALLRQPYTGKIPGKDASYKGFTNASDEEVFAFVDRWYPEPYQIQVHVNGDGTADQFIRVMDKVVKKHGRKEGKVIMIHCSMVHEDQLKQMKALGIAPSFYPSTISEAAESFVEMLGEERVARMHPAKLAANLGMNYTIHNDEPLIAMEMLPLVWVATNRKSMATGKVYGADLALTPYQALLAVTRNAALQLGEGDSKGSLAPGKRADMIILDRNPLKIDKDEIRNLQVLATIKDGKTVYATTPEKAVATRKVPVINLEADPCELEHSRGQAAQKVLAYQGH